jgi:hypothetical protein
MDPNMQTLKTGKNYFTFKCKYDEDDVFKMTAENQWVGLGRG